MKRSILIFYFSVLISNLLLAQCDVRFGSADGRFSFTDIESGEPGLQTVTAGITETLSLTTTHNLWDEVGNDCSVIGGVDDITIIQTLNTTPYDVYGGIALLGDASDKMNITQNTLGLSGTNSHGALSSSRSSTGDVRSYTIEVIFAPHVYLEAQDLTVLMGSVNTAGRNFESASIIFKNAAASPAEYGTVNYHGFWEDTDGPGGIHPGVVTSCPTTAPAINTNVYTTSGTGVYTIGETGTMDLTNPCSPVAGVNGSEDNKAVKAVEDAGLSPTDRVTGFVVEVRVENVGTATADGIYNGTSANLTSRLTGFDAAISTFILPVELTAFSVKTDNKSTFLNWQTATETNNDYFVIEHSIDGIIFKEIGKEKGYGTTSNPQNYSFIHANPTVGLNYYRLKQVDFDGASEYHKTQIIRVDKAEDIRIFPTQVTEKITVDRGVNNRTQMMIDIYEITGKHVNTYTLPASVSTLDLNLSHLLRGHYFIKIYDEYKVRIEQFIKTH